MMDALVLVVVPIALSVLLVWLRRKRPLFWWLGLLVFVVIVAGGVALKATEWRSAAGGLLIYLLPALAMFLGLRPPVFQRRRWLIFPVGIVLYLFGLALALSLNVTGGLIQP
jgi:hypothetical protein